MMKTITKLVFAIGLFATVVVSGVQAASIAPPPAACRRSGTTCIECANGCNEACSLCPF
jgi:hypothetical protein